MQSIVELFCGQMLRKTIKPQLFILPRETHHHFHTYFCLRPLDIHYISQAGTITKIDRVGPFGRSTGFGKYVLETKAKELTLKIGDTLSITTL